MAIINNTADWNNPEHVRVFNELAQKPLVMGFALGINVVGDAAFGAIATAPYAGAAGLRALAIYRAERYGTTTQFGTSPGTLTGEPEAPPRNAPEDQVRAVNRQNQSAEILRDHGFDVEQLPNKNGRDVASPDLRLNGSLADVYAPTSRNVQTVWDKVLEKVNTQAPVVVINLNDSPLSAQAVIQRIQQNPIVGLNSVVFIKGNVVIKFVPPPSR